MFLGNYFRGRYRYNERCDYSNIALLCAAEKSNTKNKGFSYFIIFST